MNSTEKSAMLLAIDAGNTRTKWALFDATGVVLTQGVCLNANLSSLDFSDDFLNINLTCRHAIISNVAGPHVAALLQTKCQSLGLHAHFAKASVAACGVYNHYDDPTQLGTDRWSAVIAAWQLLHAPCIVVNVGTAVTIDALLPKLNESVFLGGFILPGLHLMQQALVSGTQGISQGFISQKQHKLESFASNTADAIYNGACLAITGAIVAASNQLLEQLAPNAIAQPKIILSGGDASLLRPLLLKQLPIAFANQVLLCDTLVLQGLYWLNKHETNAA